MNNKNSKRALLTSVLSLAVCGSMLVGTTFAWFTDSVSSGSNVITTGNLDVELYHKAMGAEETDYAKVTVDTNVFKKDTLWEPGYVEVVNLKVANEGSLALKYQLGIEVASEVAGTRADGTEFNLSDYIYYAIVENALAYASRADAIAAAEAAGGDSVAHTYEGTLEATETRELTMIVYMPTWVGNEANHKTGTTAPSINFGLNVVATQYTFEKDSFGDDYDENAVYCDVLATPETIKDILADVEEGTIIGLADGYYDEIVLTQDGLTLVAASSDTVVGFVNLNAKDNVTLDNLTFDESGAKATYTFATGNTQTATGYVANVTGDTNSPKAADNVVIKNCTFTNTSGVVATAADSYAPIYFNEQGAATERASDITVKNCTFACNATQYIALNYLSAGEVVIADNTFGDGNYGTTHNTINATGNVANWTITGNTFNNWNAGKTAIGSSKQGSNKVSWTIIGNEFNHNDGAVILALKTSYNADNSVVTVKDNTVLKGEGKIVTTAKNAEDETVYAGHKIQLNDGVKFAAANSDEKLDEAISEGATVIKLSSGNYIIPDSAQGKKLTIIGNGETVVATQDDGSYEGCDYSLDGATVTFEGVVINTDSSTYTGYARLNATYNNCIINGTYTLYGDSTFNNCTFNVSGDVYNIWTWGAPNATFNNCTFNSDGKALLLYGQANTKLTVNNCVFNDNGGLDALKAAIEIGNDYNKSYELIVKNTKVNGYEINDEGISTGTTLWANKNSMDQVHLNVVVDGVDVY